MSRTFLLGVGAAALSAFTVTAHAEPKTTTASTPIRPRNVTIDMPREAFNSAPASQISNVIYLNRCQPTCTVTGGTGNDAHNHVVGYLAPATYVVNEFQSNDGQTGAAADAEWNMLVQCVKEIYSPFNITVTDVQPSANINYGENIVAGIAPNVGLENAIGGVGARTCEPIDNAVSFTFANSSFYKGFADVKARAWELCWTVGQEVAHNYSLDHSYQFADGTSACNDPMTYRTDCGGQKFFRNKSAFCGEYEKRECFRGASCGSGGTSQNAHQRLLTLFGAGQSLIPPPTVSITTPANNATAVPGQVVTFSAGSRRGVDNSELWLNGYKWAEVKGAKFGQQGQANPSNYSATFPAEVPNGVIDIQIKSYDDTGTETTSATVTVTKGAPCAAADTCAKGQKCEAGKCFWDAPTGKVGDSCDYNQFCETNMCVETNQGGYCSQECIVGSTDSCPMALECVATGSSGVCLPKDDGSGCCNVDHGGAVWAHAGLSLFVLGLVVRRRRRRRDRL